MVGVIIIASNCEKFNKVFRMISRVIVFKIKDPDTDTNQVVWLENAMRDIVSFIKKDREECTIGITMNSNEFIQGVAWLYYRPINTFNFKDLWDLFERISQSRREFKLDDSFTIMVTYVKTPSGKGDPCGDVRIIESKSILNIKNSNNLCLPRALVCGEVFIRKNSSPEWTREWNQIRKTKRAKELMEACGVNLNVDEGCGIPEISQFQIYYRTREVPHRYMTARSIS